MGRGRSPYSVVNGRFRGLRSMLEDYQGQGSAILPRQLLEVMFILPKKVR